MSSPDFDAITVEELGSWLESQGIPQEYCAKFEEFYLRKLATRFYFCLCTYRAENYIDGKEFAKLTESEVRDMVPPIGLAKKIIRLIPKEDVFQPAFALTNQWSPSSIAGRACSNPPTPISPQSPVCSEMSGSTLPPYTSDASISSATTSVIGKQFVIPDSWPPAIMQCIELQSEEERKLALVPSVRNEIVRVLANSMFCNDPNPKKEFCTRVAKLLVKKYKFMRDIGEQVTGYGSWEKKLIEKVHNIKARRKRPANDEGTPKAKRGRPKASLILTRYPPVRDTEDDDVAFQRNSLELSKELQRDKPRKEVILSLTRQTYPVRRASVLSDAADVCVQSLLSEYPELKKPYVLEQEIDLILEKKGAFASALQDWSTKWVSAILEYSNTVAGKKAALLSETRKAYEDDVDGEDKTALDILCKIFAKKNASDTLSYIYEEYMATDDPEEVGRRVPLRTAPRIGCFDGEEPQYFLYVESRPIFFVTNISKAVIFWFVLHYVFNLEYCNHVKSVALFFQEFVFRLPATSFLKHQKTATYLTVTTDLQKFI